MSRRFIFNPAPSVNSLFSVKPDLTEILSLNEYSNPALKSKLIKLVPTNAVLFLPSNLVIKSNDGVNLPHKISNSLLIPSVSEGTTISFLPVFHAIRVEVTSFITAPMEKF